MDFVNLNRLTAMLCYRGILIHRGCTPYNKEIRSFGSTGPGAKCVMATADDARRKMGELVNSLFRFERKHSDAKIAEMIAEKNFTNESEAKLRKRTWSKMKKATCVQCDAAVNCDGGIGRALDHAEAAAEKMSNPFIDD